MNSGAVIFPKIQYLYVSKLFTLIIVEGFQIFMMAVHSHPE